MEDQESSDIGALWEEALDKYFATTKTNLKRISQKSWTVEAVKEEQEREILQFTRFRHDGKAVDKLRSTIGRNSAIIQKVAKMAGNAASASFPPSVAIVTAFTYVMKASQNVSEDYNLIMSFYDIMGSLLDRMSLLENKLPAAKNYKAILMQVFSSMLVLCGMATKAIADDRLKKWFKALLLGSDDNLKSSYDTLNKNIQRLESATFFATLATTLDIESGVKDLTLLQRQSLQVGKEILTVSTETNIMEKETNLNVKRLLILYEKDKTQMQKSQKDDEKGGLASGNLKDSGSKRSAALNQVRKSFSTTAKPEIHFLDIQSSFVKRTFTWVDGEPGYKPFKEGTAPFLWVYGAPGCGKSVLAYTIIEKLGREFQNDPRTSVAFFFFKEEHAELRSVKEMLYSLVVQIAMVDLRYREEVASDLKSDKSDFSDNWQQLWTRFFASKYPKDGEAKLYLILDGLDEVDAADRAKLFDLLKFAKEKKANIQVVFTSRPDLEPEIDPLTPSKIELTMPKMSARSGDLWRIIISRCKELTKLQRLKFPVWKRIAVKLREKADSILYCEHVLRRLNSIGRENLIMENLKNLPPDLPSLYSLMLSDCEKGRAAGQVKALKKLFAWLAYSKRPLTLGEATCLVGMAEQDTSISLEEEIDGRSSKFLAVVTNADDEKSSDESDAELTEKHDDLDPVEMDESSSLLPLRFQERSMRQYFREMEVDETGLRSSPCSAHLTIFEMAVSILNVSVEDESANVFQIDWQLLEYAANFWLQHFLEISPEKSTEMDVKLVISSLQTLMNPHGVALKNIEEYFDFASDDLFWTTQELRISFFESLKNWAERAKSLPSGSLSNEDLSWIQEISSTEATLPQLAKCHVMNWFTAEESRSGSRKLQFAQSALRMTDIPLGLSQESSIDERSVEHILAVADAFPDIEKTAMAYRNIAFALRRAYHPEAALLQMKASLNRASSDYDRFFALGSIAELELQLSYPDDIEESNEMTEQLGTHLSKAYDAINDSLALKPDITKEINPKDPIERLNRSLIQGFLSTKAVCEVKLGNIDVALATMDETRVNMAYSPSSKEVIDSVFEALEKLEAYDKIISAVEKFSKLELLFWLSYGTPQSIETFHRAAKKCHKEDFLLTVHEKAAKEGDKFASLGPGLELQLATLYQTVCPDYGKAKLILYKFMDGSMIGRSSNYIFGDDDDLEFTATARCNLADILIEEFRQAKDPEEKTKLFNEMNTLLHQTSMVADDDFSPYESQIAIQHALMAQKLGPVREFQNITEKIFTACIKNLSDEISYNDLSAFRLLAKVLACVPGLEREAQIALSCQFSIVDKSLFQTAEDSLPLSKAASECDQSGAETVSLTSKAVSPPHTESSNVAANQAPILSTEPPSAQVNGVNDLESPEDLDPDLCVGCNVCQKNFRNWTKGAIFLCIICTDRDLCQECYGNRMRPISPEDDLKTFCDEKHHYIKGPVEGWKGVSNGVMRIGDEEIEFKKWRDELSEKKWKEVWGRFWEKREFGEDIL